jgi:hypothetical protein
MHDDINNNNYYKQKIRLRWRRQNRAANFHAQRPVVVVVSRRRQPRQGQAVDSVQSPACSTWRRRPSTRFGIAVDSGDDGSQAEETCD